MSYTVGDGSVVLALAAGFVGYLYVKHQGRSRRLEIIHQERMAAMEKGIPLPELPLDEPDRRNAPDPTVLPILGTVLLSLALGTMVTLFITLDSQSRGMWVSPLPFAFLGAGLLAFHFLKRDASR
jgi:hypothetical protein